MKHWKRMALGLLAAASLTGCGRGTGKENQATMPSAARLSLAEEPPAPQERPPQPGPELPYAGSTIWFEGTPYCYRAPESPTDAQDISLAGFLTYQEGGGGALTVDREELDSCPVHRLTGGHLTERALLLTDPEGKRHLYYPEGYFEGYEKEFQYAENGSGGITILKYRGKESHVTVPEELGGKRVTALGARELEGVFSSCPTVVSVTVPEGVAVLREDCFYGCPNLKEVRLPASLRAMGSCAFEDCPQLRDIYFAGDAPRTGNCLFDEEVPPAVRLHCLPESQGWATEPWDQFPQLAQ